ncbi:MAG: hypothetical protein KA055_02190 [Aliarcobacter sp.]|nr:hypothetical protein [Aliarcobacter sp.]
MAILIIAIIISFALPKFDTITYNSNISTLKSQLSLIQNALSEQKNKNILLSNNEIITKLDDVAVNKKDEELFTNIIDFQIISTNSNQREVGKWRKKSSNTYEFFLTPSKTISFLFENEKIICNDEEEICQEIN